MNFVWVLGNWAVHLFFQPTIHLVDNWYSAWSNFDSKAHRFSNPRLWYFSPAPYVWSSVGVSGLMWSSAVNEAFRLGFTLDIEVSGSEYFGFCWEHLHRESKLGHCREVAASVGALQLLPAVLQSWALPAPAALRACPMLTAGGVCSSLFADHWPLHLNTFRTVDFLKVKGTKCSLRSKTSRLVFSKLCL